jgi:hypothetical protein
MDAGRFDRWARALSGSPTRREALRALAAAGLVAVLPTAALPAPAAARKRRKIDPRCRNKRPVNGADIACDPPSFDEVVCDLAQGCACVQTVRGDRACVVAEAIPCPTQECLRDGDCPDGEVCIGMAACCGQASAACVAKCPRID